MGCEFGQSSEWNYTTSLDWHLCQYSDHEGIRLLVKDLNALYRHEPVLSQNDLNEHGFRWINCTDGGASAISYLRSDPFEQTFFAVVGHFTPVTRRNYRIGVPRAGYWKEMINTNSQYYGGDGQGNGGGLMTDPVPSDGFPQSLSLTLPPLATTIFKWSS